MVIFIAVALAVYALINYYVARRGGQALSAHPAARTVFIVLYIALAVSYPASRILRGLAENVPTVWLDNVGAMHMVVMLYGLMGAVLVDVVRLANAIVPFLPKAVTGNPGRTGSALFLVIAIGTAGMIIGGGWNSTRPHLRELEIHLPRGSGTTARLTAVFASDLHLGSIIGRRRLERIVRKINDLRPDVVFFGGDIVDETIRPRQEVELSAVMQTLRAPLGTFVVPGNHETFAGLERTLACYRNCGLTVLQEQAVRVADTFVLICRRDPSSLKPGEKRLPIREILAREGIDDGLPLILLDHQPAHLEQAAEAGVSLQLSGHTHAGQIFPLNIVNRWIWELNWGWLQRGGTQYYVSSGVGTWGPPVRTGSRPEIVRIHLFFDQRRGGESSQGR
jgi:predicted MPP superfamily phosphohydrolase